MFTAQLNYSGADERQKSIQIVAGISVFHKRALDFIQRARKFKNVQAKKLVKTNKSKFFFHEIAFLAVFS